MNFESSACREGPNCAHHGAGLTRPKIITVSNEAERTEPSHERSRASIAGASRQTRATTTLDRCTYTILLHDVRQFVREQAIAVGGSGRILSGSKNDVASGGVGQRIERTGSLCRTAARMNPHVTEIAPEAALEEASSGRKQGLPSAAERGDLRFQMRGNFGSAPTAITGFAMHLLFALGAESLHARCLQLILTMRAHALDAWWAFAMEIRHPHDLVSDPVSFQLKLIARLVHRELRLHKTPLELPLRDLVAEIRLPSEHDFRGRARSVQAAA